MYSRMFKVSDESIEPHHVILITTIINLNSTIRTSKS